MTRLLSISLLIFLYLLPTAFTGDDVGRPPHRGDAQPKPDDGKPQITGSSPPFSDPDKDEDVDGEKLGDLIDNLLQEISSIISVFEPPASATVAATSNTVNIAAASTAPPSNCAALPTVTAAMSAFPVKKVNATLACMVYQAYLSIYTAIPVTPFTTTFASPLRTLTPNATMCSISAESLRASCLCYSSSYFVPDVHDFAALGCAHYTGTSRPLERATREASASFGYCNSIGNVRAPLSAKFGEYAAVTKSNSAAVTLFREGRACYVVMAVVLLALI